MRTPWALMIGAFLVVGAVLVPTGQMASAQNPPATFYGTAPPEATIEAFIEGESCGSTRATTRGEWVLSIADTAATCSPVTNSVVTFTIDGVEAERTFIWTPGGADAIAFGPGGTVSTPTAAATTNTEAAPSPTPTAQSDGTGRRDTLVVAVFAVVIVVLGALVAYQMGVGRGSRSR